MLLTILSIIHVLLGIVLIIIVLLQTGRGQDVASAFGGGGSTTIFGITGGGSVLNKITTIAALMFMFTALGLTIMSSQGKHSVVKEEAEMAIPTQPEQSNATLPESKTEGKEQNQNNQVPANVNQTKTNTQTSTSGETTSQNTSVKTGVNKEPPAKSNKLPAEKNNK